MLIGQKKFWFVIAMAALILGPTTMIEAQDESKTEAAKPATDFKKLKSPIPYSKRSISRGKTFYVRVCAACHGPDGKSLIDVVADATDLTQPKYYYSGSTEGEIFRSIRDGAGVSMPPYKKEIKNEQDMWHLVNFIRSLWPKDQQPKLVVDKKKQDETK